MNCQSQQEVDHYWEKLSAGGTEVECGWLKDQFGLTWQIIPTILFHWMSDPDPTKSARVLPAVGSMKKLDLAQLQKAYEGA